MKKSIIHSPKFYAWTGGIPLGIGAVCLIFSDNIHRFASEHDEMSFIFQYEQWVESSMLPIFFILLLNSVTGLLLTGQRARGAFNSARVFTMVYFTILLAPILMAIGGVALMFSGGHS
jgi:hypothetical protein